MSKDVVKIVKVDKVGGEIPKSAPKPVIKAKTHKTFPKSILKKGGKSIKAVRDPASSPPLKKNFKKTLRIPTEKGIEERRKTIKNKVKKMRSDEVTKTLKNKGLNVSAGAPEELKREILAGALESGMIVA